MSDGKLELPLSGSDEINERVAALERRLGVLEEQISRSRNNGLSGAVLQTSQAAQSLLQPLRRQRVRSSELWQAGVARVTQRVHRRRSLWMVALIGLLYAVNQGIVDWRTKSMLSREHEVVQVRARALANVPA